MNTIAGRVSVLFIALALMWSLAAAESDLYEYHVKVCDAEVWISIPNENVFTDFPRFPHDVECASLEEGKFQILLDVGYYYRAKFLRYQIGSVMVTCDLNRLPKEEQALGHKYTDMDWLLKVFHKSEPWAGYEIKTVRGVKLLEASQSYVGENTENHSRCYVVPISETVRLLFKVSMESFDRSKFHPGTKQYVMAQERMNAIWNAFRVSVPSTAQ